MCLPDLANHVLLALARAVSGEYSKQKLSIWGELGERKQITNADNSFFEAIILFYLSRKQDIFLGGGRCRIKYLAAFSLARPMILDRCEGLLVHMFLK